MSPAASEGTGGLLGRSLLTLANVITVAAPLAADWNDSHVFNTRWPGHARFHGATALAMTVGLSTVNVWSLWTNATEPRATRLFATAVPTAYWAPFLLAPLVPGTTVEDAPHLVPRVAGVPTNLLGAVATTATALAGWYLDRRASASPVS